MAISLRFFSAGFLLLTVALFFLPSENSLQGTLIAASVLLYFAGFHKLENENSSPSSQKWLPWLLILVIIGINLIRQVYFPSYSNDFFRYFWDTMLYARGVNPFNANPATAVTYFSDMANLYEFLNSKNYFSIYPPTTQYFFQFVFYLPSMLKSVEEFVVRFQAYYTILFFICGFLYLLWLRIQDEKINFAWVIAFMMCPVFLLEGVLEIHTELIAVFFLLLTFLAYEKRFFSLSGTLFALAVWCKLNPLLLLPFILFERSEKLLSGRTFSFLSGFVLISLISWTPFSDGFSIAGFIQSISLYFRSFEYNSFLYAGLLNITDHFEWWSFKAHVGLILSVIYFSIFLSMVWIARNFYLLTERLVFAQYTFLFYMLFSSTIHPWYFLIPVLLMFLSQKISLSLITWIIFSFMTLFWYNKDYSPDMYWQFRFAEYFFVFILLAFDLKHHLLPMIMENRAEDKWDKINSFTGNSHLDVGTHEGLVISSNDDGKFKVGTDIKNFRNESTVNYVVQEPDILPFKNQSFESSSAIFVLHHTIRPEILLSEMKRVSKKIIILESLEKTKFQLTVLTFLDQVSNMIRSGGKMEKQLNFKTMKEWKELASDPNWWIEKEEISGSFFHPVALIVLSKIERK